MPSARSTIIDAIQAALISSGVSSTRVYRGRRNEINGSNFPTTYIYPVHEDGEVETLGATRTFSRKCSLAVDFWAKSTSPELWEEALDIAEDTIVGTVIPLTATTATRDNILTTTDWWYEANEAEVFGCVRITFTIIYQTTH